MNGDRDMTGAGEEQAIHVRVPFKRPIETATGPWTHRDSWIVRQRQPNGIVALGEGPTLEGTIPLEWQGRFAGQSVAVNALVGGGPLDEVVAEARAAVKAGFGTVKLKVGTERSDAELAERVRTVREAIGSNVRLRLDANGAWAPGDALRRIRAVARYDIEFVEQPMPADADLSVMAELRSASPVAVAVDESVTSRDAAWKLVWSDAADVLVVKLARVGGPLEAWLIDAAARDVGATVVMSTFFETGVGIAAALAIASTIPGDLAHGLATADLLESDLLKRPLEIVDGRMIVPETIELDEEALERYAVEWIGEWP